MAKDTNSNTTNQSTVAAFAILEELARHDEACRVTDVAATLGMPRARVYRYLQTLMQIGYVQQDPATERYRLTLKLFHLGQAVADSTQLTSVARPVMVQLRDRLNQTMTLSIPEEGGMRVIDIVRAETPVQIITRPGTLMEFHASAQGKVALAWGDETYREGVSAAIAAGEEKMGARDAAWLAQVIEETRKTGWAAAPEETLPGLNAVSAPIFDSTGRFAATITVAGSVKEITAEPSQAYIDAALEAARKISGNLGLMEYPV
ncbi:IclR family transcriptional regulator [Rhodobacteraceae bacterium D3-12]|nr:IclR family transcriptional regulator [Rhodobacteraceae bacterium D3-12]